MKITIAKKVTLLCISFCLIGVTIVAQTPKDTLFASKYFKKADSLLTKKKYNESISFFNKALPVYKKAKSWKRVADCLSMLGKNYEESSDYSKAKEFYNKSHNLRKEKLELNHPDLGASFSDLGNINYLISDYEKALHYHKKAIEINLSNFGGIHKKTANSYHDISKTLIDVGDLQKALKYAKKSLSINLKILGKDNLDIGFNYNCIGVIYGDLNQSSKALEFYEKATPYFIKKNSIKGLISIYNNSGRSFKNQGKLNKALKYYKKGLTLALEHLNENINVSSIIYMNIGNTYTKLKEYDKAFFYLEKSLSGYKSILNENHFNFVLVYDGLGALYSSKKDYNKAFEYHKKALQIAENLFDNNIDVALSLNILGKLKYNSEGYNDALIYLKRGLEIIKKKHPNEYVILSDFYLNIGLVLFKKKEYSSALQYLDEALISNSRNKEITNLSLGLNNYIDNQLLLKILHTKAKVFKTQYVSSGSHKDIYQSNLLYKKTDTIINLVRLEFQNYQDKLTLAKQVKNIYNDALTTQLLAYKNSKNDKDLISAWYYSEKSKAYVLKELLENSDAKKFDKFPNELLLLEKELKSNKAYYKSQIVTELSKDSITQHKITAFENQLFDSNRRQDSLVEVLKKKHPKYYQLKHSKKLVSIKDIQNQINEQTTLLEFFTTDSITYAFTVTKNTISVKELPIKELTQKVADLNNAITSENNVAYKNIAHSLYKELLFPIKNNMVGNELIIIPDGPLWHLNFDLLLTQESTKQRTRDLPYLLRDYAVSYGNSAYLLFNPTENSSKSSQKLEECLAFSFSDTTSILTTKRMSLEALRDSGDDLPGTRKEIKAIADIIDGQYYYGSQANEATFKQNAGKYSILHLALHGDVDNEKPQNSKLYFTKSNDTIEDNLLYGHELFALDIPADLVVLSACNTGTGKIAKGEGLMSLGNAFQYAGAKSLLLSKWEVSDKTTPELMKCFYTNLKAGMNKAKALQLAKLKYLNTTEAFYTNPFYWGSFYMLGNTDSIPIYTNFNNIYLWCFGILIGLLILVVFIRIRKAA